MLFPDQSTSAWFIHEVRVLDKADVVVCAGKCGANLFKGPPNTNLLALRVSFKTQGMGLKQGCMSGEPEAS